MTERQEKQEKRTEDFALCVQLRAWTGYDLSDPQVFLKMDERLKALCGLHKEKDRAQILSEGIRLQNFYYAILEALAKRQFGREKNRTLLSFEPYFSRYEEIFPKVLKECMEAVLSGKEPLFEEQVQAEKPDGKEPPFFAAEVKETAEKTDFLPGQREELWIDYLTETGEERRAELCYITGRFHGLLMRKLKYAKELHHAVKEMQKTTSSALLYKEAGEGERGEEETAKDTAFLLCGGSGASPLQLEEEKLLYRIRRMETVLSEHLLAVLRSVRHKAGYEYYHMFYTEDMTNFVKHVDLRGWLDGMRHERELWEAMYHSFMNFYMAKPCGDFYALSETGFRKKGEFGIRQGDPEEEIGFRTEGDGGDTYRHRDKVQLPRRTLPDLVLIRFLQSRDGEAASRSEGSLRVSLSRNRKYYERLKDGMHERAKEVLLYQKETYEL